MVPMQSSETNMWGTSTVRGTVSKMEKLKVEKSEIKPLNQTQATGRAAYCDHLSRASKYNDEPVPCGEPGLKHLVDRPC